MSYWQSYKSIVLQILGIINLEEKRDLRNIALDKETLYTHSARRKENIYNEITKYNGNKISKNSGNIKGKTTRGIYINISFYTTQGFAELLRQFPLLQPKIYVNIYDKT